MAKRRKPKSTKAKANNGSNNQRKPTKKELLAFFNGLNEESSSNSRMKALDENSTDKTVEVSTNSVAPVFNTTVAENSDGNKDINDVLVPNDDLDEVEVVPLTQNEDGKNSTHKMFDEMPENPKASWASLLRDNRNVTDSSQSLKGYKAERRFKVDRSELLDIKDVWGHCLIGYIAGRFPGMKGLLEQCNHWKVRFSIHVHSSKWLVFKFENDHDMKSVLNGGPYMIFGRPLFLKEMPSGFDFSKDELCKMPIWIQIPGIPLDYWSPSILGKLASQVGSPLAMDKLTATRERISYARLLVEVNASIPLVNDVEMVSVEDTKMVFKVNYEFKPMFCSKCGRIGHLEEACPGVILPNLRPQRRPTNIVPNSRPNQAPIDRNQQANLAPTPQRRRGVPGEARQQPVHPQADQQLRPQADQQLRHQQQRVFEAPNRPRHARWNQKANRRWQPNEKDAKDIVNTLFKPTMICEGDNEGELRYFGKGHETSDDDTELMPVESINKSRWGAFSDDDIASSTKTNRRAKARGAT